MNEWFYFKPQGPIEQKHTHTHTHTHTDTAPNNKTISKKKLYCDIIT